MADAYVSLLTDHSLLKGVIESDLRDFISGSERGISSLVDMNMALFGRLKALETEHFRMMNEFADRGHKIDSLYQAIGALQHENDMLMFKIAVVDDSTRLLNLRVDGVQESQNENLKQVIADCLSKTGITCNVGDIDYARRLGKFKQGNSRSILVRLQHIGLRTSIFHNKAKINQNSPTRIWVNDDVSDITQSHRKQVRDVVYLAKQNGIMNIKIHTDGVIIDDKKFHHADLDLLPPNISLE